MSEIATILIRKGTAAQWATANPILANGEPGWVTDRGLIKIGDGSTAFTNLPYAYTKIPDATATSKGLATAAQVAQINTNKNNIQTMSQTVNNHGQRLTTIENTTNTQGANIATLLLSMPKAHCVRLALQPTGEDVSIYKGEPAEVLYCAINGTPINTKNLTPDYKIKLDGQGVIRVDFIFKNDVGNNVVPKGAFAGMEFSLTTAAVLILPCYITKLDDGAIKNTILESVISFAVDPPNIIGEAPTNVAKVYVPAVSKHLYETATGWDSQVIDVIANL